MVAGEDVSTLSFWVRGLPGSQGSKRPVGQTKDGHAIMIESDKKVKPWRMDAKEAAENAMAQAGLTDPFGGPLVLQTVFYLLRPKGHYRTGRFSGELKASAPKYPIVKPDLDKILRAVGDALKPAGVYVDDSQIVRHISDKVYACPEIPSPKPGAIITVRTLDTDD